MDDVKGDPMPDDLDDIDVDFDLMSTRISDLSKAESRPDEFTVPEELEPDAIDWDDFNWVSPLLEVQQWLHFDNEVSVSSDLSKTIRDLFEALTDEDAADNYSIESGQPEISSKGWAYIDNRLGQATQHMQEYCLQIDNGLAKAKAVEDWSDAWDSDIRGPRISAIEINAKTDTWSITKFSYQTKRDRLNFCPPYQRNDVWSVGHSQQLIDSVLRGIPLPSVILNKSDKGELEIVDGKQRLTAIFRFMGMHPKAIEFVKKVSPTKVIEDLFHSDFPAWKKEMTKIQPITSREVKEHFLPFPLKRLENPDDPLAKKGLGCSGNRYYCQIKEVKVEIGSEIECIEEVFTQESTYKIPVILYQQTELDQIALVFNRYNTQGVKLNAEEIRNAKFHDVDLCAMLLALSEENCGDKELIESFTSDQQGTIPMVLYKLGFKDNRFVRTKYACWVASLLAQQPNLKKGTLTTPSPKIHIDSLFHSIENNSAHPLHAQDKAKEFSGVLIDGIRLLKSIHDDDGWPEEYTSKRGNGSWDALPLVSSWLACSIAINSGFSLPGSDVGALTKKIRDTAEQILPPDKQQSKTQWEYFASTTLALLDAFDLTNASANLESKLNYSCLETFETLLDKSSPAVAKP
jgi:hypothetical protein